MPVMMELVRDVEPQPEKPVRTCEHNVSTNALTYVYCGDRATLVSDEGAWCDAHRPEKASAEPKTDSVQAFRTYVRLEEARADKAFAPYVGVYGHNVGKPPPAADYDAAIYGGTLPSMDANLDARLWVGIDLANGVERLPAEIRTYNLADYDAAREAAGCREGESLAEKVCRLVVNEKCARMDVATAMAMVDQLEAKARDLERALSDDRRALIGRRYTQTIGVDRDEDE